jgi:hypothetical protein
LQAEEIDVALDELETRLDRLRSLYEQYFLGIEKIEPTVARKDVDRRFWLLRRTQIRNTARRFRLQVLIQRYNTFQQYWARICREIENGTYSRHLLRAQKKLGEEPKTWAAKKRLGYFRRRGEGENGSASERPSSSEELGALLDGPMDLEAEAARAAEDAVRSAEVRARQASTPSEVPKAPAVGAGYVAENASKPRAEPPRRGALEMLDLDLDDGLAPSIAPRPAAPVRPAGGAATAPARPQSLPLPKAPTPASAQPSPPPRPVAPTSRVAPQPLARPAAPASPAAPQQAVAEPKPAPARPPLPKPATPAVPEKRPEPARPQPPLAGGGISDDRLKQIHAELSAAKRQAKQTDAVSLDVLSKSLRESEKRIQAQHPGRNVDFHVVVKDGKPVVKPIVRK